MLGTACQCLNLSKPEASQPEPDLADVEAAKPPTAARDGPLLTSSGPGRAGTVRPRLLRLHRSVYWRLDRLLPLVTETADQGSTVRVQQSLVTSAVTAVINKLAIHHQQNTLFVTPKLKPEVSMFISITLLYHSAVLVSGS